MVNPSRPNNADSPPENDSAATSTPAPTNPASPLERSSDRSARRIPYLDHHATTPIDERVREAMEPYLGPEFGNAASSTHAYGWRAEAAVDLARECLAELLGAASPSEIVFTSGATESNNLAILGLADASPSPGHMITVVTEHPSVLDPCRALLRRGWEVTELGVDSNGLLAPVQIEAALREDTRLVSVMSANNEIGVLQPIAAIAELCRGRGVAFHSDAAQAVGKISLPTGGEGLDLVSVSAHKFYGPKGVGCLRLRKQGRPRLRLEPRQYGGGHEGGLRSGTLPVALIVGMARALEIALAERDAEAARVGALRDGLWGELKAAMGGRIRRNGEPKLSLAGNLNVTFEGIDGERLLGDLGGLAVSSGSACSSATPEPSHVLLALGHSPAEARASLRFGLGRGTTQEDVTLAVERVVRAVEAQRGAL